MERKSKARRGRPPLGDAGRTRVISIKLSEIEYEAITTAVKHANANAKTKTTVTVSSWIRDHALKPLNLTRGL